MPIELYRLIPTLWVCVYIVGKYFLFKNRYITFQTSDPNGFYIGILAALLGCSLLAIPGSQSLGGLILLIVFVLQGTGDALDGASEFMSGSTFNRKPDVHRKFRIGASLQLLAVVIHLTAILVVFNVLSY